MRVYEPCPKITGDWPKETTCQKPVKVSMDNPLGWCPEHSKLLPIWPCETEDKPGVTTPTIEGFAAHGIEEARKFNTFLAAELGKTRELDILEEYAAEGFL